MNVLATGLDIKQHDDNFNHSLKLCVHKKSRQRDAILKALRGTASHPTAAWIYDEVRKVLPNISLGTIYRNLRLLREQGEISEIEIDSNAKRFDANLAHHYHFQCDCCGQIFDIVDSVSESLSWQVSGETGFQITRYRFEFHGLCLECQTR